MQKKQQRFTYHDARAAIQASDAELDKGLRDRRVLILNGTSPFRSCLYHV